MALSQIILRGWMNFVNRTEGPLWFRFVLQPAVGVYIAIRAGRRDAALGRPPFWVALADPAFRRGTLIEALRELRSIILLATVLDVVYQLLIERGIYFLELVFTVLVLAVLPYAFVRGPASRLFRRRTPGREFGEAA